MSRYRTQIWLARHPKTAIVIYVLSTALFVGLAILGMIYQFKLFQLVVGS